ncbi:MAG: hypothetical protein U1F52_02600 [Burkholderiales bacterium]
MKSRTVLATAVLAVATFVHAAEPAPAPTPAKHPPAKSASSTEATGSKKKLGSFKEYGQELGKLGSTLGKGTVKTGKSIGGKVSSDVKNKNFKPNNQASPPEPNPRDRAGNP